MYFPGPGKWKRPYTHSAYHQKTSHILHLIEILMLLLVGSTIKIVVFVKLTWVAMAVMAAVSPAGMAGLALPVGGWMYCACRERKIIIANI